nr:SET domain-containing protein [uncultured Roseateles sp.]
MDEALIDTVRSRDRADVDRWLWDGYRRIDTMPDSPRRRRAHMTHVLDCQRRVLALMPRDDDRTSTDERARQLALMSYGTERWLALLAQVRLRHRDRVARRDYAAEHAGDPPFRDADHGVVHVVDVLDRLEAFADVEPYTDAGVGRRTRAAHALRLLEPRRIAAADLRSPREAALIGQRGLFARHDIAAGTCLGVYGGQLLDDVDLFLLDDDRYLMSASDPIGEVAVNGENLLSLMNTLFLFDADGRPDGHPVAGYNVRGESFRVRLRHGWTARIHAFRASEDIPAGRELRWNYDLGGIR